MASNEYIAEIAVYDRSGTLHTEQPVYIQAKMLPKHVGKSKSDEMNEMLQK
jgi:hypothetical protein